MANVLIVAYLFIVVALIAVILIQRSEGGGLGMGTANSNGLVSVRGSANLLTRTTSILAALFFATAIGLTILAELDRSTQTILDKAAAGAEQPASVLDALKQLDGPAATTTAPATDTAAPTANTAAPATDSAAPAATDATAPAATTTAPADTNTMSPATDTMAPATDTMAPATDAAPAAGTTEQPAAPN